MINVLQRVVAWNQKRYEQEFHKELFINMSRSEYKEWLDAKNEVDKLDALCDCIYIALGASWKANIAIENMNVALDRATQILSDLIDCTELWPAYFLGTYLDVFETKDDYPLAQTIALIVVTCMTEMRAMGLSQAQCEEALLIVCDSNDTKTIKQLASDEKGFKEGKGEFFIAPEPKLQLLLDRRHDKLN